MGSVIKSAQLNLHTRTALLKLFSALPYSVLWKFAEPFTALLPNVHVRPWLPQPCELKAVRAGVPLLTVPVFGDQPSNADRAQQRGYALKVDFSPGMVPELGVALKEMLSNDNYSKQAKHLSHLFQSRPTTPQYLINHYVLLAIENKGAYHLRCVPFFLVGILAIVGLFMLSSFLIKTATRKFMGKDTSEKQNEKKSV